MSSGPGYLRDGVNVRFSADKVQVAYALWEVGLPAAWVRSSVSVQRLLERTCTAAEASSDPKATALVQLLEAQGCFVPVRRSTYTLREVREIFDPLRSAWYATYYAHPTWERLRTGRATRNELVAWLIHNYHTSRAAGVVAARMASLGKAAQWTSFFRQDALDEYWHCDAFYFIDAPHLRVSSESVKDYVPLPSSTAFEHHTLRLAEADPLGHLLTAYFQESSIAFESDSTQFYRDVESAYEIPSFFQRWKQHIRIDVEHEHAEGLGRLLDSETTVDAPSFETALRNAWLSFHYLLTSLEDIRSEERGGSEILLRRPIQIGLSTPDVTSMLDRIRLPDPSTAVAFEDMQRLYVWYVSERKLAGGHTTCAGIETDLERLLHGLALAAFRALGFSRTHDEVIACGRSARLFSSLSTAAAGASPHSPWCVAVVNYLLEGATSPTSWLLDVSLLLDRLWRAIGSGSPLASWSPERTIFLDEFRAKIPLSPMDGNELMTGLLRFDELIARFLTSRDAIPANVIG